MNWIVSSEKDHDFAALEKRLWDSADQLRDRAPRPFLFAAAVIRVSLPAPSNRAVRQKETLWN
jgi:hypothetical protein